MKINGWVIDNGIAIWQRNEYLLSIKQEPDGLRLETLTEQLVEAMNHTVISRNREAAAGPGLFICVERAGVPASIHKVKNYPKAPTNPVDFAEMYRPEQVLAIVTQ